MKKPYINERLLANFSIALEAVIANRLRSFLTALGIIFGVAAVIAMMAIGNGAQQEILEQIKLVGVNNIVIEPISEQFEEDLSEESDLGKEKRKFSPGLRLIDIKAIETNIPGIAKISPEIVLETNIVYGGIRRSAKLVGIKPAYFDVLDFKLGEGRLFSESNEIKGDPVCIIGKGVQRKFFPKENPIGRKIKSGNQWLEIIGIMEERFVSEQSISKLGIRDFNMDVYIPIQSMLVRFKNRDLVTGFDLEEESGSQNPNYHQIDKLVIQVSESESLNPTAEVISKLLSRSHNGVVDFEITIPELLLKQQQRTQNIFNIVLGAIAGISLLVGGIGIMNIMLASVMERIKEIGLRLSLGAKKSDIVNQFLFESIMISVSGGLIGVILGVVLAYLVSVFGDFPTVVSFTSIVLSFGVAATVGLIFGIAPAQKAASQDPITSLRYE
ncbi:ABC-type antimicrobial peptide transport system, permease component [Belliella baltica DSM 15883]|uniref:ABC-type antimicrobial peptide transport system, permease component n=1 Tax=Belliella baltica (strain DSM 15883 / CIP 108006 / LMG 21964 / BA134) TaxID=866536 RepID=I3Z5A5_BELBD|nr:ABC transporter permease [Belliella baltica]AFL84423.1 ABC-type antimicrobial peptide transport system, permease component [Belliella baltica DSM 15883]